MIAHVKAFGAFWYDFIIGDDWRIAAGVVAALAITYALARGGVAAWWVVPAAIVMFLPLSLWRATRSTKPPSE